MRPGRLSSGPRLVCGRGHPATSGRSSRPTALCSRACAAGSPAAPDLCFELWSLALLCVCFAAVGEQHRETGFCLFHQLRFFSVPFDQLFPTQLIPLIAVALIYVIRGSHGPLFPFAHICTARMGLPHPRCSVRFNSEEPQDQQSRPRRHSLAHRRCTSDVNRLLCSCTCWGAGPPRSYAHLGRPSGRPSKTIFCFFF